MGVNTVLSFCTHPLTLYANPSAGGHVVNLRLRDDDLTYQHNHPPEIYHGAQGLHFALGICLPHHGANGIYYALGMGFPRHGIKWIYHAI